MTSVTTRPVLLVVAKVPVPGLAKTRLVPALGLRGAAELAQAALLDTLDACVGVERQAEVVVALTGELEQALDPWTVRNALSRFRVIGQRGEDFGARLANAHHDAASGRAVIQIGMDTPQVTTDLLSGVLDQADVMGADTAGLGPATDGGWWVLTLPDGERAAALRQVPMSRDDTAAKTRKALQSQGCAVVDLPELGDVDTIEDLRAVLPDCTGRVASVADRLLGVRA